jgi:sirohydrochlorin ferrochelatase
MTPMILVSRGSRQPAANAATRALAQQVGLERPGARVRTAFLGYDVPDLRAAIAKEAGLAHGQAVIVPLLLGAGHSAQIGFRTEIERARQSGPPMDVRIADVLGPTGDPGSDGRTLELIVAGLMRRLCDAPVHRLAGAPLYSPLGGRPDAIVLATTGSRVTRASQAPIQVARALSAAASVPVQVAHVDMTPTVGDAIGTWLCNGATGVAVATYLLVPGERFARMQSEARRAGAMAVAPPLSDSPELAQLVLDRADRALG